jgi:3-isopropylmalate/(R)-2-methylmalate dehydratase small subunit
MSMQPFTTVQAIAAPIDEANVDTNQLCPTRFNKVPRGPKYAEILFYDQRFDGAGQRKPFLLNDAPYDRAGIIVADRNFGCGSSRETAVYALYEFGIRCVIAPSYGDIFAANCAKNGLLALTLDETACKDLRAQLRGKRGATLAVDLAAQTVTDVAGKVHAFEIPEVRKRCLLLGLDDIARTGEYQARIDAFETAHRRQHPWMFGGAAAGEL